MRLANDTYFGLSAAVIAGAEDEARRIAHRLDAGTVSVQDTFLTFAGFVLVGNQTPSSFPGWAAARGILAFLRNQAVLTNTAEPACIIEEELKAVRQRYACALGRNGDSVA